MSDFVAKLRARTRPEICNCAIGIHLADGSEPDEDCVKAADTIDRLTAEIDRLRSLTVVQETLIRKAEAENEKLGRDYQSARDAHDRVLAENERLRAALEEIIQDSFSVYAIQVARAALSGDKP